MKIIPIKNKSQELNNSKPVSRFPIESIMADLIFILINIFLFSYIIPIIGNNLLLFAILAIPFQAIAIFAGTIGLLGNASLAEPGLYGKPFAPWRKDYVWKGNWLKQVAAFVWWMLIGYLYVFGLSWLSPTMEAVQQEYDFKFKGDFGDYFLLVMVIITFVITRIAFSYSKKLGARKDIAKNRTVKYFSSFTVMLFLTYITAMLTESYKAIKPHEHETDYIFLLVLGIIMYLPLRLILLLRPPFNFIEVITFATAYTFFILELIKI